MSDSLEALHAQFHQDMVNAYQTCINELHYRPTLVLSYLGEHTAVETACWLVNLPNESSGFTKLWQARRLDLSAEAMILKPEYATLFSVKDRRMAYDTLKAYNYTFPAGVSRPKRVDASPRESSALAVRSVPRVDGASGALEAATQ